ncbi:hypothetical protein [Corynebacterium auriscanis]|uniref:hypothetical protein n=1 Tax=Corynebacterium auriscanis TaxID=99807 RepID=UPI0024AE052B|nr:hypothetical protein [Corynebacterium auriscanis]
MKTKSNTDLSNNSVTVTIAEQQPPLVAESARTISGLVLPWEEFGRTNNGALKFEAGSIRVPADITRVKLLAGHSPAGIPVGHATSWEAKDDGLHMTFQFGSSDDATKSLKAASEHVVDAFSVECYGLEAQGTTVKQAILSAVALVPMPAFANARVATVTASAPAPAPAAESTTDDDDSPDESDSQTTTDTEQEDDMKKNLTPGTLPGSTNSAPATINASFDQVVDYLAAAAGGDPSAELHAELTDITDAGMTNRSAPQWLGELWSGVTYERRIIPLLTQAPLKSRKAIGYRWKQKPGVDKYSGNKTDIPSKPASVEPVERDAQRWAGGNDLDRVFWDFNEREFLAAYWRAMAESYAYETDQEAGKFLVENANAVDGTADNIIHAVARGSIAISQDLRSPASFVLLNPQDYEAILQLTALDAPKYLDIIPATDPSKWVTSDFVDKGTIILGAKSAVTHYELAGSPLRVEAEHIAKGGRDAALFGYTALMLNRPEGLRKVTFTPASTASAGV